MQNSKKRKGFHSDRVLSEALANAELLISKLLYKKNNELRDLIDLKSITKWMKEKGTNFDFLDANKDRNVIHALFVQWLRPSYIFAPVEYTGRRTIAMDEKNVEKRRRERKN